MSSPAGAPAGELALVTRARLHGERVAVEASDGTFTYADLLRASERVARALLDGRADLEEARVAFLVPPGFQYVAVQWGVWRAGGIAVPLAVSHPPPELAYVLDDAEPEAVVVHPRFEATLAPLARDRGIRVLSSQRSTGAGTETEGPRGDEAAADARPPLPRVAAGRPGMMLYTSGSTGRPKGVVTTHATLEAQITSLVEAWEWSPEDRILHVLPLHHLHGILNILSCALWSGARCHMRESFHPEETWRAISRGDFTLFMGVPTVYAKLLAVWDEKPEPERAAFAAACRRMRLMVSGSAALPVTVLKRWEEVSGHLLLERYGMTEIGMGLSNPLRGERRPGFVGQPLPGVRVRLTTDGGDEAPPGTPGEIEVRGVTLFLEYWRRPAETDQAFHAGWFRTGDVAVLEEGSYRILGRSSVDIIKTGGFKVSALEVEEVLREHPSIRECGVVGLPDAQWGERVAAALVFHPGAAERTEDLREWVKERLAPYKAPTVFLPLAELPRNAMGKVVKPEIRKLFEARSGADGEAS
jgi:malonyl-CoA/methylmalonyl-CoA synthetase